MTDYFDPLSYDNLGLSIVRALLEQPVIALHELKKFDGAGIYALYYTGNYPAYRLLSAANREEPGTWALYVGKAEAESARKGDPKQSRIEVGPKLFNRINNHRKSIEIAKNLEVTDFQVRTLAITPTWIPLAEIVAIRLNQPVWNKIVDGLGNHDPGAGRRNGMRPRWDTLHPGRPWAEKLMPRKETAEDIEQDVIYYLRTRAN